jgi:acetyl-CoA C-acetyltransferase
VVTGLDALDPRTPVVVAVGQSEQRTEDPATALEPTALLAEAARTAVGDCGAGRVLDAVDTVAVIQILSHAYRDPAIVVAGELGIDARRTILTDEGGNYPQSLLNRACREISAGRCDGWLIGGGETWRTRQAAIRAGMALAWTTQGPDVAPTEMVTNGRQIFSDGEAMRGVIVPATVYALFENALRAARGWTIDEHRDQLARLYASFSEVAQHNPHAWIRRPWTAAQIREATPDNRMIGFPYTKVMNANNAVEQAACIVVTSVERARALGVPTDRWVFPWAGTDAHEHWFVSNRWSLAAAPAIGIAGRGALELAGIGVDDLAHIDVYSCFPSAVQIAAAELGLSVDRPLTVTGGLSFAGGPWNNYVTHAIATMVERLRADEAAMGMVTANGGYLTKHAFGIFSSAPPPSGFRHANLQAEVDAMPSRQAADVVDGPVAVESAVVVHGRDQQPERAVVAALLADGRRAWGGSSDEDTMDRFLAEETSGAEGQLGPDGTFRFGS